jgi:hypothetical protein
MAFSTEHALSYELLESLRQNHPAWKLLRSDHAPLIASFLHKVFLESNERFIEEANMVEALEDTLYALRTSQGENAFPRAARDYLNDWADPEKGWVRKFYRQGSDAPFFDLTPATERAIAWLQSLGARSFVGTESRLLTIFDLLRQMRMGTETDPELRLAELRRQRDAIDAEIARVTAGELPLLDDTKLRDRFQQFTQLARELLSDFREVEANFRKLDRDVRERIALWEGGKSALLDEIFGRRDAITDSDQGRSFHAFWDFLMSSSRQEELTSLLREILEHPALREMEPDPRLARIHYDWLDAGEHTQRTVSSLSKQLRRFLDDQAWLENRRIMDLLHGIETRAIALRENLPSGAFMDIAESSPRLELPMERPLYTPPFKPDLLDSVLAASGEDVDAAALFAHQRVDKPALERHIRKALQNTGQASLGELIATRPLRRGLAELVVYLDLGVRAFTCVVDENATERITWQTEDDPPLTKTAALPRVTFLK